LAVPREGVKLPLFFCRINEEDLITKSKEKLKKGDVVLLEGFLQTQKIEVVKDYETTIDKISSVNCYRFTFLDSDSATVFSPLDNLVGVAAKEIRKNEFESDKEGTKS
jgi:single-stranded DNA-binding protein